jgi:hypothetical protein
MKQDLTYTQIGKVENLRVPHLGKISGNVKPGIYSMKTVYPDGSVDYRKVLVKKTK